MKRLVQYSIKQNVNCNEEYLNKRWKAIISGNFNTGSFWESIHVDKKGNLIIATYSTGFTIGNIIIYKSLFP